MKIYEYIIRMKDQASDKLNRLASSFSGTESKASRLSGATDRLGNKLNGISKPTSSATSSFSQLGNEWTRSLSLGNMLTRVVGPLALGAALTFGASKASSLSREFEQTNISFEIFMGSATKAKALIGEVTQLANVTPFTRTELLDSAKLMMNFGIANEKILPNLKMLGDISGGNAQKMHLMTLAFSQSAAAGRLMGQDLLQMVNAGFNPLQEISKKTGLSMVVLKKKMEDGAISTKMVEAAFRSATSEGGRFFGMMDRQSQTFEGRLSTLRDKMEIWATSVGDGLNKVFSPILDKIITGLDRLTDATGKAFNDAGSDKNIFSGLHNNVRPLLADYDMLYHKSKRTADENRKLMELTQQIGNAVPASIEQFDSYGRAKKINMIDAEVYIRTMENKFLDSNTQAEQQLREKLGEVSKKRDFAKTALSKIDSNEYLANGEVNTAKGSISKLLQQAQTEENDILSKLAKLRSDRLSAYLKPKASKSEGDPFKELTNGKLKDGINGISGGGKQSVNVTINLQSLIAEMNFSTTNVKEGMQDVERMVTEALLRVVNSANYAAAQ